MSTLPSRDLAGVRGGGETPRRIEPFTQEVGGPRGPDTVTPTRSGVEHDINTIGSEPLVTDPEAVSVPDRTRHSEGPSAPDVRRHVWRK